MGRRRGFFAEIQHQARLAERDRARRQRESERQYRAALREAERTRKAEERAARDLARATEAQKKHLAKEAKKAHVEAMQAEVGAKNLELAELNEELRTLLSSALESDDYVELDSLMVEATHPPFGRTELEVPAPFPAAPRFPKKPELESPAPPTGMFAAFKKSKHSKDVAAAEKKYGADVAAWERQVSELRASHQLELDAHALSEKRRLAKLATAKEQYSWECAARVKQATEHNETVESLKTNLAYGVPEAIEEYLSIVLSNSVYPTHFEVSHEFSFEPAEAELKLRVLVPEPRDVSTVKSYKYTRSTDAITSSELSKKAQRDRYSDAVHQVALRTFHEVFGADRRSLIRTIRLEVGTETIAPATGLPTYVPFVAAGAERASFVQFDLAAVVPRATLKHLGAAVSKNPMELVPAKVTGIRQA